MNVDPNWLKANFPDLMNISSLGQGGQKLVLAATHPTDGDVVLKLIHPPFDVEAVRREILAVQQVQSPRVPRILQYGTVNTQLGPCFWLREQRILGNTVRQLLQNGPLGSKQVLLLGRQMLEALVKAEGVEIVHRDVKPDNIMFDNQGDFWLLDFGIARHLQLVSLTATVQRFGKMTVGYAPPEQCRNMKADIDSRADLFALGVTLYECATGTNPFCVPMPRDQLDLLSRVETWILQPLQLPLKDSASFRDLVDAMTQKRRDHRPRTAQEAFNWMDDICRNEGV